MESLNEATMSYDKNNDILYVHLRDMQNRESYGFEILPGLVLMRDIYNSELTGMTIFYPEKFFKKQLEGFLEKAREAISQ